MIHRRKGYILLAVLGIAVIVTALGLSFVESHSTAMPESVNRYGSMRALYLAESGVAIGSHFLMYPPTTVNYGQYYTGANNVAVDATSDYTNISVLRSDGWSPAKTDLNLYRITATGVAHDPDGSVRGKRQVTAEVIVPEAGKWIIPYACFDRGTLTVPARTYVYGDLHANGAITGAFGSYCNGNVSSTGTILWLGGGPPTSQAILAASYSGPAGTTSKYETYTIRGTTYNALVINDNDISKTDADALNAVSLTSTNPGRVVVYKGGDIIIRANVSLQGTLVVTAGDAEFRDSGAHQITAESGFPAMVIADDIIIYDNDEPVTILGSVILADQLHLNNSRRSTFNVTGSLIKSGSIVSIASDAAVRVTWDANRSWFWDVESTPTPQPITVLNWKED